MIGSIDGTRTYISGQLGPSYSANCSDVNQVVGMNENRCDDATCRLNQSFTIFYGTFISLTTTGTPLANGIGYDNNNGDLIADSAHTLEGVRRCARVSDILSIIDFPNVAAT